MNISHKPSVLSSHSKTNSCLYFLSHLFFDFFKVTTRMRNFNVITDGLDDESPNNDVKCIYKEVVVVGE